MRLKELDYVSFAFLRHRYHLSWQEVHFGLRGSLLDRASVTYLAADVLLRDEAANDLVVELAGLAPHDDPSSLVERLVAMERAEPEARIREKWLCIALDWAFEHREAFAEPLRLVEEIYAYFDYPPSVAGFVFYMPTAEPFLESEEAAEMRLVERWGGFVHECRARHGVPG